MNNKIAGATLIGLGVMVFLGMFVNYQSKEVEIVQLNKAEQNKAISKIPNENKKIEIVPQKNKVEIVQESSFYYEPNEDGVIAPNKNGDIIKTEFQFTTHKIAGTKIGVHLLKPVSKDDIYTTQIFLNTIVVLFNETLPRGNFSKYLDFVSLDTPKNQEPKPCCDKVIRVKINDNYYFISNLAAEDSSNTKLVNFTIWKESVN